jgi:uncharacterized RDD family membrane protein YckC
MRYAGVGPRAAAVLIDAILAGIPLSIVVGILVGDSYHENGSAGVSLGNWGTLVWALAMVAYYAVAEGVWGTSIGKRILNLRVQAEEGGEIDAGAAVIRNLARFVDGFPYFIPYALGAILIGRDEEKRRLGDQLAHTVVTYRD